MNKCIICENNSFSPLPTFGENLAICDNCSLVTYKDISEVVPEAIYNRSYFERHYYNYASEKPIFQKNFAYRLKLLRSLLKTGRILEIGMAYGFFLELANKFYETFGIDISKDTTDLAKSELGLVNISCGDYLDVHYEDNFFDGVCLFDTIEHLKEPHLYIEKIYSELRKGGIIYLTTGDINSLPAKLQKKNWRLIDPPTHLYYFSFNTMKKLLEKYNFQIIHASYPGNYRSLAFMIYFTFFKKDNRLVNSKFFKLLQRVPVYTNLYDIMTIIAKK